MMDWERFFKDNGIEYVTYGPNVKKGNINIACPLCGDDPSHHMGVAIDSEKWGCWRSTNHAGRKAYSLIHYLLGCSFTQARLVVNLYSRSSADSFDASADALLAATKPDKRLAKIGKLTMPLEFKTIRDKGSTKRFFRYLENRGFEPVPALCKQYELRCATSGHFKDRIVIPIYMKHKLISWTTRAISNPKEAPRYLALSEEEGGLVNVFDAIWNWDNLIKGGDILFIVEGPIDALKFDFYGKAKGVRATCTFGTSMSMEQAFLIADVSRYFKKSFLLYDPGATEAIFEASDKLSMTNVEIATLPDGVEDPGAMSKKAVRKYIDDYL